jgi:hypothetical protein
MSVRFGAIRFWSANRRADVTQKMATGYSFRARDVMFAVRQASGPRGGPPRVAELERPGRIV